MSRVLSVGRRVVHEMDSPLTPGTVRIDCTFTPGAPATADLKTLAVGKRPVLGDAPPVDQESKPLGERGPLRISDRALVAYLAERRAMTGFAKMTPEEGRAEMLAYLHGARCTREPTAEMPGTFRYRSRAARLQLDVTAKPEGDEVVVLTAHARAYVKPGK